MTAEDFIKKWQGSINYHGLPTVGINVQWSIIPLDSKVGVLSGIKAWERLYHCVPPWFETPQTFRNLVDTKNSDYQQIVREETEQGKIEYYHTKGLQEPFFCVFASQDGSFNLLGDGNHRFLDCIHLIHYQNHNFDEDIKRTSVDIIYLTNFVDVLRPDVIWKTNWVDI
ncbi:hypothetical protein A3I56_00410 [Candidatus Roizmanbacteria bacterium RIFCSPLOWO2_02_FULL_43_10]|uniref:Uncharacterized protein n=3 Tax=Candidatus Roizmaniibacteriota TaxID=1752723 RepID=A0A1F7K1S6_9BACT|nr:MAG: hypothetical protein A3D08_00305 [Candidatus Roizmanbacteria bacterium RIFCSPHIGHO2_02_FULL_43_11]OGK37934.1 MAG: hypothetical protein A3F32_02105 [Candidatus Roizmanbacteria bacterium RIFCSPHIGHO2_12_FULL_42_10]OGK61776.1 MAG: hypothetical protein A3I56_00410 [Candidatus Roizmanbacteria bacterium RIFCSPLOWO2_02_FULL_43_10]